MIGAIAGIAYIANIVNIADATNAAHIVHVLAASVPSTVPVTHTLPDIPRSYTAICEWAACMVYIAVLYRRVPLRRSIIVSAVGLPAIVAVQYFDGSMPIWFWIVGMLLAFGCMYLTILFGAGTGKREGLYITARAFVLAELVASLHWQIVAFIGTHDAQATSYGVQAHRHAHRHLRAVFRPGMAGGTRQFQPNHTHATDRLRGNRDGGHHHRHLRHEQSELRFDQYAILRFDGTGNFLHSHAGGFLRFCDFVRAAGAGAAHCGEQRSSLQSTRSWKASIRNIYSRRRISSRLGRLAHDLKHQIAALRAEVDPEHAAAGFEQLEKSVQRYSAQQHTGNPVLDVILTTKERTCNERGITFTAVADGSLLDGMSSMDIASLFGNALDNAIEATSKLAESGTATYQTGFVRTKSLYCDSR